MKIKRVLANNRKKCFVIEAARRVFEFPYSQLKFKPTAVNPVVMVHVDPELAREGFTYTLRSGREESILIDEVLFYNRDPEYLCELMLHDLTVRALSTLSLKKIPKRELARRLKTSPRQLYRLLDPTFYGKTIDQMVKLLYVLGHEIELQIDKRAA